MPFRSLLFASAVLAAGCSSTSEPPEAELPARPGLAALASEDDVTRVTARLDDALADAEPVTVVAEIDHSQNAQSVGLPLRPTRVRLFGNPVLGTPLMLRNPLAGLDLPQKVLVYEDEDDRTVVAYNTSAYLAARYGLVGEPALGQIGEALDGFARTAAGTPTASRSEGADGVRVGQGIVTVDSQVDFNTTYGRIRAAVTSNPDLRVIAEVNHEANARSVGLTLRPTQLIVFGNPRLGTPLMQESPTAAIDLPQTVLVYQPASGPVRVAYEDPGYIAERHGIVMGTEEIEQIRAALSTLVRNATDLFD